MDRYCNIHKLWREDNKKQECHKGSEILVSVPTGVGSKKNITLLGLIDTGSSASLANINVLSSRCKKKKTTKSTDWVTQGGDFSTESVGLIDSVKLPQFTTKRSFGAEFHLFTPSSNNKYDFIIGRDILQ